MDCLTDFNWDSPYIELVLNEYALPINQQRPWSECVLRISLCLTVNTFNFMINHEFESFISGMSGVTESNFMSGKAA